MGTGHFPYWQKKVNNEWQVFAIRITLQKPTAGETFWETVRMTQQRTTKQLVAIREAIEQAGRPLTIEEIHSAASERVSTLGIRTVYRVVRKFQEAGEIVGVPVPGGSDRYELASVASKHHHHFHCTSCDRFFDIHGCAGGLEALVPEGFKLMHHDLTLSGLCDACA